MLNVDLPPYLNCYKVACEFEYIEMNNNIIAKQQEKMVYASRV